jgi:hypothetical protein
MKKLIIMKKLIKLSLLLCFVLPILITSCDKDELSDLVGTWEYSDTEQGVTLSISITFNSDNTGKMLLTMTFAGETETESGNFTWSTEGDILSITTEDETTSVKYSISGNKLTITEDGEDMVFTRK